MSEIDQLDRIYVYCPYALKDLVKQCTKAKYCKINKSWYVENKSDEKDFEKILLNVPYEQKEEAKLNGACWDSLLKKFYTPAFNNNLIKLYC
jgi:hypothetical protein